MKSPLPQCLVDVMYAWNLNVALVPPDFNPCFRGTISVAGKSFQVRITNIDPTFERLPKIYLEDVPQELSGQTLPHVNPDGSLCYVDLEGEFFDPLSPERAMVSCLYRMEATLALLLKGEYDKEFDAEFSSYWRSNEHLYLRSDSPKASAYFYKNEGMTQAVIAEDLSQAQAWIKSVQGAQLKEAPLPVLNLQLRRPARVPMGMTWPPVKTTDLFNWLAVIDRPALSQLASKLPALLLENLSVILVIHTGDGPIAVGMEFHKSIKPLVQRAAGKRQRQRVPEKDRLTSLSSSRNQAAFFLLQVHNATDDFLLCRNRPENSTLKNKRIALIGCGTIGGYAAQLLCQVGAGAGNGSLTLYDMDQLETHNLGRHILGAQDLGKDKSQALASYLRSNSITARSVHARQRFTEVDASKYELIIDATGNENFSTQLPLWVNKLNGIGARPTLLHGWVDAGGWATRALLDDGSAACYGCLRHRTEDQYLAERFPIFGQRGEQPPGIRRQCGSSYQPYDSAASVTAAALIQQLACEFASGAPSVYFKHYGLKPSLKQTKDGSPSRLKGCPLCRT
ncbi:TPA: hypothetical protein I8220_004273 [Aeromonas hydrophila]|uniref:ThiF family adenylyltransferase n=1 Tax=Aeromonas caviae TaxID=648 RepID=UPI001A273556|nr:ThiF family adenylyltransferase [Aeromonas caviae]HAT2492096.1 hypothetical protein [Aeromonas hydrophila]MDN6868909.1 ThiF family adenylyltransferase [Aeromonas caviae]HAT2497350.1 hypothetical protein [Aeromonas hydrophila]HAT2512190.1 hypothetical protein [Aeromonas hydrophila]HAT2532681.1 hypothetical protein [Aeromonas hydrophila]